jgi:hypothetical protein
MTLENILDPFRDRDLASLSRKAREAAVGCGQKIRHPKELPFDDWSLLDDIARSIFEAASSDYERVAVFFDFFERFPAYHVLTTLFRWYDDHPALADSVRSETWRRLGMMLGRDAALADPVAYKLWADRFEDPRTVADAWERLLPACASEQALQRLLEISGPVPIGFKQPLYLRLLAEPRYHTAILRSMYFSARDVYGVFDREAAGKVMRQLLVDHASTEFQELQKMMMAEPCAPPNAGPATQLGDSGGKEGPSSVN